MDKLKMQSFDVIGSNIQKIQQLFPNCVTERLGKDGKPELAIDFEKLQAELSNEIIGESEERYQFTWPDKRAANRLANTPTTMTLRPCREESVDFDQTQNLYIEGDNLDVLKALRETYLGKVKMIYIDPPYNTGNDFVYNDDFAQSRDEFEETSGLFDEVGNQTIDPMQRNTESNGRFHTDWLNMIYPRLKVARDLLSDDGVIFISIDDNEVENLKKICNEIFGEGNFIAQLVTITNLKGNNDQFGFAGTHEYALVYGRCILNIDDLNGISLTKEDYADYTEIDEYGKYKIGATLMRTGEAGFRSKRPKGFYPIYVSSDYTSFDVFRQNETDIEVYPLTKEGVEMSWRRSPENLHQTRNEFVIKKTSTGISFYKKQRLEEDLQRGKKPKTLFYKPEYSSGNGTGTLKELFRGRIFDNPKPISLLYDFIKIGSNSDSLALDFFSGSATTAHAVMQLNAEDGGNRKFIMVQLPEKTDPNSGAYNAGYKNICEIGKERIRRAGKKIKEDFKDKDGIDKLDIGFRVLKLDSSNMQDVYYRPEEFSERTLFEDNIKPDRTPEDLLFQVMLDLGIELSSKIETKQIGGKSVYFVDSNYLIACFDEDVNEDTITEIAKMHPVYFVMRDASAAKDNVIDNFGQIFSYYSPETICKIL